MCKKARRSLWRHFVAFWGDRRGAVAPYFGVTMVVIIGVGAFTVDLGRVFSVGSELQSAADALSLAGAAELDGETDAIDRATLAVTGSLTGDDPIIVNGKTFAGAGDVTLGTFRFLHSLPPDDVPIDATYETTDPLVARFIEVTVTPATIRNLFIPVVGGPLTIAHSAVAVAGFTQVICQFPPLMICNPPAKVIVEYAPVAGLGFVGRPGGPVPAITVRLQNMTYDFIILDRLFGLSPIAMPAFTATLVGEDLNHSVATN